MIEQFLVKAKFTVQKEDGSFKRANNSYIVPAYTFSMGEERIYKELEAIVRGEFSVVSMAKYDVHEIFSYDDTGVWYVCKITFEGAMEDEKSKKVTQKFLVEASSVPNAHDRLKESLEGTLLDYVVDSVVVTNIEEVFFPEENLDREISRVKIEDSVPLDYVAKSLVDELN
jgi:hypothetical protein